MKKVILIIFFISSIYASNDKFNIDLISTKLIKLSNNTLIKEKPKKSNFIFNSNIKLKSKKDLYIELYKNKIILRGYLSNKNSKKFGEYIRLIQQAVYTDIPQNVLTQTDQKLTDMMIKNLSNGYNITHMFKDIFTNIFEYSSITKYAKYTMRIQ